MEAGEVAHGKRKALGPGPGDIWFFTFKGIFLTGFLRWVYFPPTSAVCAAGVSPDYEF